MKISKKIHKDIQKISWRNPKDFMKKSKVLLSMTQVGVAEGFVAPSLNSRSGINFSSPPSYPGPANNSFCRRWKYLQE